MLGCYLPLPEGVKPRFAHRARRRRRARPSRRWPRFAPRLGRGSPV